MTVTSDANNKTPNTPSGKSSLSGGAIGLLIFDTTARLFVPSVGGTILGLWADNSWQTKPWFTILGVSLGTILAFLLVYAQIKSGNMKQKDQ